MAGGVSSGERFLAAFHNTYRPCRVTKLTTALRAEPPLGAPLALRSQSPPPYNAGHDPDSSMACSRHRASGTPSERSPARAARLQADPHAGHDRVEHPGGRPGGVGTRPAVWPVEVPEAQEPPGPQGNA